jgi:hypothetical protein
LAFVEISCANFLLMEGEHLGLQVFEGEGEVFNEDEVSKLLRVG